MKLYVIFALAFVGTCLADDYISNRIHRYDPTKDLSGVRAATGVRGLTLGALQGRQGLAGLVTEVDLDKARDLLGVNTLGDPIQKKKQSLIDIATGYALEKAGEFLHLDSLTDEQRKTLGGLANMAAEAAGRLLGIDNLTVEQLQTREGLINLASGFALSKARNILEKRGFNTDSLKTPEDLAKLATDSVGKALGIENLTLEELRNGITADQLKNGLTKVAQKIALQKAGQSIGVDDLDMDKLSTIGGLANVAAQAAGQYLGVDNISLESMMTKEGLKENLKNLAMAKGKQMLLSAAIGASPAASLLQFALSAAGK